MRVAICLVLLLGCFSLAGAADHVAVVVLLDESAPEADLAAGVAVRFGEDLNPDIRILDGQGTEVPGIVEDTVPGEKVFRPESGALSAGEYTVYVTGPTVTRSVVVGPDVYPPRIVQAKQEESGRDSSILVTFSEPLDYWNFDQDSIRVYDLSGPTPVEIPGTSRIPDYDETVRFTPTVAPGIPSGGKVRVETTGVGLMDRAGNRIGRESVVLETLEEETREGDFRSEHAVVWSNRTSVGYIPIGNREEDTLVSDEPMRNLVTFPAVSTHHTRRSTRNPTRFPLPTDPDEIAIDPRVDIQGRSMVYGVDPIGDRVVAVWTDGVVEISRSLPDPRGIAVDPDADCLYLSGTVEDEPSLVRYSLEDWSRETIPIGRKPQGVACSREHVVALSGKDRTATVVDAETFEVIATLETDRKPVDATVRTGDDGVEYALITCRGRGKKGGTVLVYDLSTMELTARLTGFRRPGRTGGRGTRVWVAEEAGGCVTPIDVGATPVVGESVPCGKRPIDVSVSPDDAEVLFVVNGRRGRITVVDATNPSLNVVLRAPGALGVGSWREE